ncbi:hypothetical protein HMPREF0645_2101 [Hallella bergensis DSM 17361]|uniref:Uncharacterized protein n=1 Tax=Hallella bergensis DSM 17361 TaxID=585502 RepID=D1PYR6_9BACT|nr:hypothetical protein HMPREF0645_2101 [Hallella bergensis DSM 17361]
MPPKTLYRGISPNAVAKIQLIFERTNILAYNFSINFKQEDHIQGTEVMMSIKHHRHRIMTF